MNKTPVLSAIVGVAATLLLSACASTAMDNQRSITLHYTSSTALNPNLFGEASPLLLTVYQLKNIGDFNQADYFALQNSPNTVLGKNLLEKESYLVIPGENKEVTILINSEVHSLAFVAGYSEINTSTWRLTMPIEPNTHDISLELDKVALLPGASS